MKKRLSLLMIIVLTFVFGLTGCADKQPTNQTAEKTDKKPIELRFAYQDSPTGPTGRFLQDWASQVEAASNGTLKIIPFSSGALGAAKDYYDMLVNGSIDIASIIQSYNPGKFPMTEALSLPMLGWEGGSASKKVIWDIYNNTDYLKKEYQDIKVITLFTTYPTVLATKNKKIAKISDINGLQLRTTGKVIAAFTQGVGASPIAMPAAELYTSIEKGVVDGLIGSWGMMDGFKLQELNKEFLDANVNVDPLMLGMSKKTWDSLPPEAQKALEEKGGTFAHQLYDKYLGAALIDEAKQKAVKSGGTITVPSPELKADLEKAALKIHEDWVKTNEAKGLPAQQVLDKVKELAKKYNQ